MFRIKLVEFKEGKSNFTTDECWFHFSLPVFRSSEHYPTKDILTARWITDGIERCVLGHVAPRFLSQTSNLDGRVAQIVDIFDESSCRRKIEYSNEFQGVCRAVLIDYGTPNDLTMKGMLSDIESDVDVDED